MIHKHIKIQMPKWVKYIIDTLEFNDYEAYVVGGCVRDSLLNRHPKDWDITTNAKPQDVIYIFERLGYKIMPTGLKHGTVTVVVNKENFEITTYRIDGEYCDGRHPSNVEFTSSLKEDLSRRDFTINAMAYNERVGVVDYFGGIEDLKDKVIRCVGNADRRFTEDALRMMRCIRFASELNFIKIEDYTLHSIKSLSKLIKNISQERIRDEICKILVCDKVRNGIILLQYTTLLNKIIPELENCFHFEQHTSYHSEDVFGHTLKVVENIPPVLELRLAALLHDIGKTKSFTLDENGIGHFIEHHKISADMSRQILMRLKFDNKTIDKVCLLVYEHMIDTKMKRTEIKKLINRVGRENIDDLIQLAIADRKGMAKDYQKYNDILELKGKIDIILNNKEPISVKDLNINGRDLIDLGFKQGSEIGLILNELLELILKNPELNNRETLLGLAKSKISLYII